MVNCAKILSRHCPYEAKKFLLVSCHNDLEFLQWKTETFLLASANIQDLGSFFVMEINPIFCVVVFTTDNVS